MIKGIYTPIVTPFDTNGEINYDDMEHNINLWNNSKLDGLVVLGSNGEFPYISEEEKLQLTKFVIEKVKNEKKVIVGTGCDSTRATIELSNKVADLGADATLILPPHYYKKLMDEEVLLNYFKDVADNIRIPVILYNMPTNTGVMMSSRIISQLSKHPNIVGIKDTSGNIAHFSEILRDSDDEFAVFAGNAGYLLPALTMGAVGGTLALANCLPDECCRLVELYKDGKIEEARKLQLRLLKINKYVTGIYGIPGLKVVLNHLGFRGGYPRKPLLELTFEQKHEIINVLDEFLNKEK